MMKKTIIILILFAGLWGATAYANTECRSERGGYCVELAQAAIPGLEFLRLPANPSIGQIISALYVFGLSLVGISSLIMIIIGGVLYMTAGDNQSRTTKGKEYITNALFGLVLALLSWLILYTLNPDLVKTLSLNIDRIPAAPPLTTGISSTGNLTEGITELAPTTGATTCHAIGGLVGRAQGSSTGIVCVARVSETQYVDIGRAEGQRCTGAGGEIITLEIPNSAATRAYCSKPFK